MIISKFLTAFNNESLRWPLQILPLKVIKPKYFSMEVLARMAA